ncbi:bifunctional 3-(3-hydroxy-phenyl)propionate/3-hydroxycinnamic acid hydroxylase [Amycolatopsis sp. H20-H5]|uniref:bifunctional 3-(3-hydroxy-phenyl)propionate/3-hydroxycinnamic acid hydroxylase n=1 Tax=Amycolatopsis sp. H20-H5 TaxID=3046309 RepID=UPI002DB9FB10|nr:bifunctional 3-(3-hydroxy-phenyl)propionate/3-hydroxycinnamic acid hydroxylase [Amycolatopsis sp. H20-H5]MEC3975770.1 bifunctional 3-(3-hydroxy-phenyl)propionate/3-hydroxycinnamic acid hydroxylase [Amycolatopsis sp. H20-H5]
MAHPSQHGHPALPLHTDCDVAIVGYGPVGMITAGLLAQQGLNVVVAERWPQRYSLSRAGHLDGETMRTLQHLGVAEAVELVARPMLEWSLLSADMQVLATLMLGKGGSGWKESYLSYQPEIEAIFDARVRELGVTVHMGTVATHLEQDSDAVTLTVVPSHGPESEPRPGADPRTIRAGYVIGADGARSWVRTTLGIDRMDLGFPALDQLVIDLEHRDPDVHLPQLPEVYQVLDIERPLLAGRWSGPRHSRFEFAANNGESRAELVDEQRCWELLARWDITPEMGKIERRAVYTFESTLTSSWRQGRVLLAGDAAHTMPPFMGQGMCSGVRDAANLSWKLAAVMRGEAADTLLDTYEAERAPHVQRLTEISMAFGDLVLMRDPELARQRDETLRSGTVPTPPTFPRLGPGIVAEGFDDDPDGPAGRPSPQARVALDQRVARLDEFVSGWRIVSRHAVATELFDHAQRDLLTRLDTDVVHVSRGPGPGYYLDIDGEYDQWFQARGVQAFLQRPDGYVFGTARSVAELPALLDELAAALARHGWYELDEANGRQHPQATGSAR